MAFALRGVYKTTPINKFINSIPVVAGDLIIVAFCYDEALTTVNIIGGSGTTWQQCGTGQSNFVNALISIHLFYTIATIDEDMNISAMTSATNFAQMVVHVVSGAEPDGATVLDTHNFKATNGTTSTSHVSANITTTNANDYIFTFWAEDHIASTFTENGTGFKQQAFNNSTVIGASFDKVVSATGTYNQAITTSASAYTGGVIAAFKMAATPIIDVPFVATPTNINQGASSTLSWNSSGATTRSIDQGIGAVAEDGTAIVSPTQNTTYTLSLANASGTITAQASVGVIDKSFQLDSFQNNSFQVTGPVNLYNATQMMAMI